MTPFAWVPETIVFRTHAGPGGLPCRRLAPYFSANEIQLANGESTTFQIALTATTGFHEFTLAVTYITGSRQEQLSVPGPFGGLFKIAGRATSYYDYRTAYWGLSANQLAVATRSQGCQLFPDPEAAELCEP